MTRFVHSCFTLILLLCLLAPAPTASCAELARIAPGIVLDRAGKAWETIQDYQAILHQTEQHTEYKKYELWAYITLVKPIQNQEDIMPVFLAEFYDVPVSLDAESRKDKEPKIVYFSNQSEKLYTYKPSAKSVTIEYINDMGPLPEFLHIAGFLHFDIETLKEKAYLNDEVFEEEIDGTSTYKVEITPRKKMRDIEPPRHIWIEKESNMPKQLSISGDIHVLVEFDEYKINQGVKPETLEPDVPRDVTINDKTR